MAKIVIVTSCVHWQGRLNPVDLHALNPSMSLSTPASNPLQAQMREDYATTLMNDQHQLLQQNPSGATYQERAIGQELNGYTPR